MLGHRTPPTRPLPSVPTLHHRKETVTQVVAANGPSTSHRPVPSHNHTVQRVSRSTTPSTLRILPYETLGRLYLRYLEQVGEDEDEEDASAGIRKSVAQRPLVDQGDDSAWEDEVDTSGGTVWESSATGSDGPTLSFGLPRILDTKGRFLVFDGVELTVGGRGSVRRTPRKRRRRRVMDRSRGIGDLEASLGKVPIGTLAELDVGRTRTNDSQQHLREVVNRPTGSEANGTVRSIKDPVRFTIPAAKALQCRMRHRNGTLTRPPVPHRSISHGIYSSARTIHRSFSRKPRPTLPQLHICTIPHSIPFPARVLHLIFAYLPSPHAFASTCRASHQASRAPQARGMFFLYRYGAIDAIAHALLGPYHRGTYMAVLEWLLRAGAVLPRWIVQMAAIDRDVRRVENQKKITPAAGTAGDSVRTPRREGRRRERIKRRITAARRPTAAPSLDPATAHRPRWTTAWTAGTLNRILKTGRRMYGPDAIHSRDWDAVADIVSAIKASQSGAGHALDDAGVRMLVDVLRRYFDEYHYSPFKVYDIEVEPSPPPPPIPFPRHRNRKQYTSNPPPPPPPNDHLLTDIFEPRDTPTSKRRRKANRNNQHHHYHPASLRSLTSLASSPPTLPHSSPPTLPHPPTLSSTTSSQSTSTSSSTLPPIPLHNLHPAADRALMSRFMDEVNVWVGRWDVEAWLGHCNAVA
ncbi:uncharacterized protein EV422DRAFT_548983 [Fimicolochytrium jonesii]|uniref:uncharacterized protein n=1 Tax=Fimicolochytrium jonesii TaxID=1396493 RepID=UPI0022FF26F0|nr:uncharacterized protein EV422DRAFT_548983 [Fimicolochytrium jonesii]KAI8815574.1 hypothetical protein EV422DRAFT_548983 [Fimicolochytrium jonesii]